MSLLLLTLLSSHSRDEVPDSRSPPLMDGLFVDGVNDQKTKGFLCFSCIQYRNTS